MKKRMILTRELPEWRGTRWECTMEQIVVRVMAQAEGYAMVRRKGCIPFVCRAKDLSAVKK